LPETDTCFVYVTAPGAADAERIGRDIVGSRLAAAVNILPGARCLYWWQGRLEEANEAVLILKTRRDLADAAVERVRALHSYKCPCAVILPIDGGNAAYLEWIRTESGAGIR